MLEMIDPNVVLGSILLLFVLLVPKGLLPLMASGFDRLRRPRTPTPVEPAIRPTVAPTARRSESVSAPGGATPATNTLGGS
jgi:hypothetical protein